MIQDTSIAVIGAGNMGKAMIGSIVQSGLIPSSNILVSDSDPATLTAAAEKWGVSTVQDNRSAADGREVVILCIKPQEASIILGEISPGLNSDCLIISIMAGVSTQRIESGLGSSNPVVRVMPNILAKIRASISAICPGRHATSEHVETASKIIGSAGPTVRVEEKHMDAVTGLSGSGPAYIYLLIDALADGGVNMGLPKSVALQLATHTVLGAARMVAESGDHPAILKDSVTSPGGTTIAGLQALEKRGFRDALMSAVEAATRRSIELGKPTNST